MPERVLTASILAVVLTVSASAQVQKKEVPGIRNYSRVDATVGCGGSVDPTAMAALKREGFVSVINLREQGEEGNDVAAARAAASAAGLQYIHLPLNGVSPDPAVVDRFLAAVAEERNQPVFIHCGSANRVGAVWMIKRVLQDKWTLDRARAEADAIGLRSQALADFAAEYIARHQ